MPNVILRSSTPPVTSGWQLLLVCDHAGNDLSAYCISLTAYNANHSQANPATIVAAFLPAAITIPHELVNGTAFVDPATLATDELKAAWAELWRRLKSVELSWSKGTPLEAKYAGRSKFLGIDASGALSISGRASLTLGTGANSLDGLVADFSFQSEFTANLQNPNGVAAAVSGSRAFSLRLRLDDRVNLSLGADELNLFLPGIELALDELADFDLTKFQLRPLPLLAKAEQVLSGVLQNLKDRLPLLTGTTVTFDSIPSGTTPQLALLWKNSALYFALARPGFQDADFTQLTATKLCGANITISAPAGASLKIADCYLARGINASFFTAKIGAMVGTSGQFPDGNRVMGPFRIAWSGVSITLTSAAVLNSGDLDNVSLRASFDFTRLSISLVSDPATVLSLKGKVDVTPSSTSISALSIIEPTQIDLKTDQQLLRGGDQVLQFLFNVAEQELTGASKLLDVLGKFATAVAQSAHFAADSVASWAAEKFDAIASHAANLFKQLPSLPQSLGSGGGALSQLDFEFRIAVNPFELRQVVITPHITATAAAPASLNALGFRLEVGQDWSPALLLDFVNDPGAYFLVVQTGANPSQMVASLGTDLWLSDGTSTSSIQDATTTTGERPTAGEKPLLEVVANSTSKLVYLIVGIQRGKPIFLKRAIQDGYRTLAAYPGFAVIDGPFIFKDPDQTDVKFQVHCQTDRILPLFGMGETGSNQAPTSPDGPDFVTKLKQRLGQVVKVVGTEGPSVQGRTADFSITLQIQAAGVTTQVKLTLSINFDTMGVAITGPTTLPFLSHKIRQQALGLTWLIQQKDPKALAADTEVSMFRATFANGESAFELDSDNAVMELHFDGLSNDGTGVIFNVTAFRVGRSGLDLDATVSDRAVRLNGLDVPFQFSSGSFSIKSGKLVTATIAGKGQLPPDLIGDAACTVNLTFAQGDSGIVLQGGKVEIDKKGEPIVCHSTRFTLTITDLDLGFAVEGGYHFYFLVTGSLRFTPNAGEFADGFLKFLKDVEISLERAPLTGDPRVLAKYISFQKELVPKKTITLFDVFHFELRGFGYHASCPSFEGSPPAISLSGQVILDLGDVVQTKIDLHEILIAGPAEGESLPRVRADGLGIELQMAGSVKVGGSILAVDPQNSPTLFRNNTTKFNASGFLGHGTLEIPGWGQMQATLGFLEVLRPNSTEKKISFFFYIEADQIAIEIPTAFWVFYLREVGFGFGFRYTLAGIEAADHATSTAELIRTLDDVSKTQGDLADFNAWNPEPDGDRFTLALKGAMQVAPADEDWDQEEEEKTDNPFLFDMVVALRSDLTFLMSARVHTGVNYASYLKNTDNLRSNPLLRGFLYISVPRNELLLRAVSNPTGYLGKDSKIFMIPELREALTTVAFSATLYIGPGLFQYELGWPDQLWAQLSSDPNFNVRVSGGMIFRVADDGLLYDFNIQATAHLHFGGSVGGTIGVSINADLDATFIARFIAYLAWDFTDSLVYGLVSLDARLAFNVSAWMHISLGFTSFTITIGFSFSVQFTAAVELVLSPHGLGAHVQAGVAIQVFGCTLGVDVSFTINGGELENARARVARFLTMSLTADQPAPAPVLAAQQGDKTAHADAQDKSKTADAPKPVPAPVPTDGTTTDGAAPALVATGQGIRATDFWIVLRRAQVWPEISNPDGKLAPADTTEEYAYAFLVPKEATGDDKSSFYSAPIGVPATPPPTVTWGAAHVLSPKAQSARPLPKFCYYDSQKQTFKPFDSGATPQFAAIPRWFSPIPLDRPSPTGFYLKNLFDQCFLCDATKKYTDPLELRYHGKPDTTEAGQSDQQNDEQRRRLQQQRRVAAASAADENAYQGRSTVMALFVDQFVTLATNGKRTDLPADPNQAPAHVTDLGLVFFGKVADLTQLALAVVTKSDTPAIPVPQGTISVLNPRETWFDRADPLLTDAVTAVEPDGIKLNWRLTLPFSDSYPSLGENPEHFLHHYEITRTSDHADFQTVTAIVKSGATIGAPDDGSVDEDNKGQVSLLAPDWQMIDSLDNDMAVPAGFREALLPAKSVGDAITTATAWLKVLQETPFLNLYYTVTPVDIAGVRGLPKSFVVTIQRPMPVIRPALAELRIGQSWSTCATPAPAPAPLDSTAKATPADSPAVYLAVKDDAWDGDTEKVIAGVTYKFVRAYALIVQPEELEPAGHYGSDAASTRSRSPSSYAPPPSADEISFEILLSKMAPPPKDITEGDAYLTACVEPDASTRRKFSSWACLIAPKLKPTDPKPGASALDPKDQINLINAIRTRLGTNPRRGFRFALETRVYVQKEGAELDKNDCLISQRVPVPVEHIIGVNTNATIKPEVFEWAEPLDLPAPAPQQVSAVSGFARFYAPARDATLQQWLSIVDSSPPAPPKPLVSIRDSDRRILTAVSFAAMPQALYQGTIPALTQADASLIANYDLYQLDLDSLVSPITDAMPADFGTNADAWRQAQLVGRIELLTEEAAHLVPESNKDFNGWQAHYPSETQRAMTAASIPDASITANGASRPLRAAWYSPAESTVVFPQRRPRYRFFPQAPEYAIGDLLKGGVPYALHFKLQATTGSNAEKLTEQLGPPWIPDVHLVMSELVSYNTTGADPSTKVATSFNLTTDSPLVARTDKGPLMPSDIRHALLGVGADFGQFPALIAAWQKDPASMKGLQVVISACDESLDPAQALTSMTLDLDFRSPIHPFLEELLGELSYYPLKTNNTAQKYHFYRGYNIMVQPALPLNDADAAAFFGRTQPGTDPYGWGILQSLGLAAALRIYDTNLSEFMRPHALARLVSARFDAALARWNRATSAWNDPLFVGPPLGQPFVEFHLKPGCDREAAPFDSSVVQGLEAEAPDIHMDDDGLSLIQISLRPTRVPVWKYWTLALCWNDQFFVTAKKTITPDDISQWVISGIKIDPATKQKTKVKLTLSPDAVLTLKIKPNCTSVRLQFTGEVKQNIDFGLLAGSGSDQIKADKKSGYVQMPLPPRFPASTGAISIPPVPALTLIARAPIADGYSPADKLQAAACVMEYDTISEFVVTGITPAPVETPADGFNSFVVEKSPSSFLSFPTTQRATNNLVLTGPPTVNETPFLLATDRVTGWQEADDSVLPGAVQPDPFSRFAAVDPKIWAAAAGGTGQAVDQVPAAKAAYVSFLNTVIAASNLPLPDPDSKDTTTGWAGLAKFFPPYIPWLQRFLDYSATASPLQPSAPSLALAAPQKALPWRLAPDEQGQITLNFLHSDRWAHARAYAVKPISRYQNLLANLGLDSQKEAGKLVPKGASSTNWSVGYAVAVSHRTEKLEPPVIFGLPNLADALPDSRALAIARHGEESLAMSNRMLLANLEKPNLLLTTARVYRSPQWLQQAPPPASNQTWETLPPVPLKGAARPGASKMSINMVEDSAKLFPTLFKGATLLSFDTIPSHYNLAVYAFERAGIVVSEPASLLFHDLPRRSLSDPTVFTGKLAPLTSPFQTGKIPPQISVVDKDDGNGSYLLFTHPLLSHAHLAPKSTVDWIDVGNKTDIAWAPDPDIIYVLQRRTNFTIPAVPQVEEDLELRLGAKDAQGSTTTRARGTRYTAAIDAAQLNLVDGAATPAFTATTPLFLQKSILSATSIYQAPLAAADLGTPTQFGQFHQDFDAKGGVFTQAIIVFDLAPKLAETIDAYQKRLRQFLSDLGASIGPANLPPVTQQMLQAAVGDAQNRVDGYHILGAPPTVDDFRQRIQMPLAIDVFVRTGPGMPQIVPEGGSQSVPMPAFPGTQAMLFVWTKLTPADLGVIDANPLLYPPFAGAGGALRKLKKTIVAISGIEQVRLKDTDVGAEAQVEQFNTDAAGYAGIFYLKDITFSLLPPADPNTPVDAYLKQVQAWLTDIWRHIPSSGLFPKSQQMLRDGVTAARKRIAGLPAVTKIENVAQAVPVPLTISVYLRAGELMPQLLTDLTQQKIALNAANPDPFLFIWDLIPDDIGKGILANAPANYIPGKILKTTIANLILGAMDNFKLKVIDSRANTVDPKGINTPGLRLVDVERPPWLK